MEPNWPFDDPRDVAVITLRQVVREGSPILRVTHDDDDGCWQFLDGNRVKVEDGLLVSLEEMIEIDPTLAQLADMPPGWVAWREGPDDTWQRAPQEPEDD
jgi:hypothetical protein